MGSKVGTSAVWQCWSQKGHGNGWENAGFWRFGPPACFRVVEGKQKLRDREERLPTSFLPNQVTCHPRPQLVGQKECLDVEYKPCLESGNALEGTSKNVLENSEIAHPSLISQMGKGLSTPIPISSIRILSGRKVPNACPASPVQPLSSSGLPSRTLFSSLPPSCPTLLHQSDALSLYASMPRTAWPHSSVGTTTTLSP